MGKNTNIVFFFSCGVGWFVWLFFCCCFFCSGAILKLFGFVKHNLTDYNYQY